MGEIVSDGEDLWWSEHHPSLGRTMLVRRNPQGQAEEATPSDANVRSRVHEYGGAAWWVQDGICVYSDDSDGQLRKLDFTAAAPSSVPAAPSSVPAAPATQPTVLTRGQPHQNRWADFRFLPDNTWLIGIRENHHADGSLPQNEIAAVALDGSYTVVSLARGADFFASPRISPDGRHLTWLSWNLPDMPWDSTQLWVADLDTEGATPELRNPRQLAGQPVSGEPEWLFQPQWHGKGLYYVSEKGEAAPGSDSATGNETAPIWSALWLCEFAGNHDGAAAPRCLLSQPGSEIQIPQWVFGESRFALTAQGPVWATSEPAGDQMCFGSGMTFDGYSSLSQVRAHKQGVVALAGRWDSAPEIVYFERQGGQVKTEVIRPAGGPTFDAGFFPPPEPISFGSDGSGATSSGSASFGSDGSGSAQARARAQAHALYFPPAHPEITAPPDTKPPLIVLAHGGPTAAARKELSWNRCYWTSRGFAVVDVNYRGSTGFGRQFRDDLKGLWGIADVADCVAAAEFLCQRGDVDPSRLAIIGGSAGGYSVLCALCFADVFSAGVSRYGIADLEVLARDTHKFECRYLDSLVGPYPQQQEVYRQRSPIHHTKQLSCPMLILQGEQDKVVPPEQAELMVAALKKRGLPYGYLTFADEGHGFRHARSQIRAREAELSFFGQIFGFAPADEADPDFEGVEISGLRAHQANMP